MTEIAKSDVFFFITSIVVLVIGVLLIAFLIYSFFIIRKINKLVNRVKEESEEVIDDMHEFRMKLKEEKGFFAKVPGIIMILAQLFKKHKHKHKKHD